jgi:hypothetical protein
MTVTSKHLGIKQITICLSVVSCLLVTYYFFEHHMASVVEAKQLLIDRSTLIQLGTSKKQVEEFFSNDRCLKLRKWGDAKNVDSEIVEWRVNTPPEFGAKEWVLTMLFMKDEVVALGFRTADSDYERPVRSPEDRFTPSIEETWRSKMEMNVVPTE